MLLACRMPLLSKSIIVTIYNQPMKPSLSQFTCSIVTTVGIALVGGCASSGVRTPSGVPVTRMSADEQGFVAGTGAESQDLVAVTDKMARSVLAIPQIANAPAPPVVI